MKDIIKETVERRCCSYEENKAKMIIRDLKKAVAKELCDHEPLRESCRDCQTKQRLGIEE